MTEVIDRFGRKFKTLRVSLLNTCNLGCVYCNMADSHPIDHSTPRDAFSASDLLSLIERLHRQLDLQTIRLTGGEPLLYPDLIPIIQGIGKIGIGNIKLTSNGFLLERMADRLKEAGLKSMNVSLDAIEEATYLAMSKRRNVDRILKGIERALETGIDVKINAVIMKNLNEDQIFPLLDFAFERNITIRFLEVMAMGHLYQQAEKHLFYQQEILSLISTRYQIWKLPREASSTANYWITDEGHRFGVIANESEPFCHDCNRLRLDSKGNIYGCLSSNVPISIADSIGEAALTEKLEMALNQKQTIKFTGSPLSMLDIGG